MSRTEGAGGEEPRHPGPAVREGFYPTFSHSATPFSTFAPLSRRRGLHSDKKRLARRRFSGGSRPEAEALGVNGGVQSGAMGAPLQVAGRARPSGEGVV